MPIEFFNKEILLRMGNQIGKETKVDEATASISHRRFARVCVEVDLDKLLVPCVRVMCRVCRPSYHLFPL